MAFRLLLRAAFTILIVWALARFFPEYVLLIGGWKGAAIIGALITLLSFVVRPVLFLLTFPLRLIGGFLAIILLNFLFLWIIEKIAALMDPTLVQFDIRGGFPGWFVVSVIFGLADWVMKELLQLEAKQERREG